VLYDLSRRLGAIAGSVVTLVTALAVGVNLFVAQVAPELPHGWQDNATRVGGAVVSVLLASAAAVRRVTEVPVQARGLTLPAGRELTVEVSHPGGKSAITTT